MNTNSTQTLFINELPPAPLEIKPNQSLFLWFVGKSTCEIDSFEIILHQGARFEFTGLIALHNTNSLKANIKITHKGPKTFSRVNIKGVLFDSASLNIETLVRIVQGASGADTNVLMRTLIAGPNAHDASTPSMEIQEQEVSAHHAVTIGQIQEDELFYLESRGIDKDQARELIISGFLKEVIDNAPKDFQTRIKMQLQPYGIEY